MLKGTQRKFVEAPCKALWRFLRELEADLLYDPGIPSLGIYLKKRKTLIPKDMCITALFTIAKIRKQPNCSSKGESIKKM